MPYGDAYGHPEGDGPTGKGVNGGSQQGWGCAEERSVLVPYRAQGKGRRHAGSGEFVPGRSAQALAIAADTPTSNGRSRPRIVAGRKAGRFKSACVACVAACPDVVAGREAVASETAAADRHGHEWRIWRWGILAVCAEPPDGRDGGRPCVPIRVHQYARLAGCDEGGAARSSRLA